MQRVGFFFLFPPLLSYLLLVPCNHLHLNSLRFKGAWCSVYEKEPVTEVFGTPLVMADSLVEMADKIIAASAA